MTSTNLASSPFRWSGRKALGAAAAFGATVLLCGSAQAQDQYLVKNNGHQPLRDLNFITPRGDQELADQGATVVQGDFDGDGLLDSAQRGTGVERWSTTAPSLVIDDELPFFDSDRILTAVGDFNGDLIDEIAWRLDGCPFWVVNDPAGEDYPIFDGINGLVVSGDQMSAEVGDFDCDGK
ncbi:MAG: hypothetical protein AAF682_31635, partial [Planctomycetota bacterium]